jgi:hypothetical protein
LVGDELIDDKLVRSADLDLIKGGIRRYPNNQTNRTPGKVKPRSKNLEIAFFSLKLIAIGSNIMLGRSK